MSQFTQTANPKQSQLVQPASREKTGHDRQRPRGTVDPRGGQQALGNQTMQSLLRSQVIQAKLAVSTPGDRYEQEADQAADAVMRQPEQGSMERGLADGVRPPFRIQRALPEDDQLQRQAATEESEEEQSPPAGGERQGPLESAEQEQPEGEEEDGGILLKSLSPQTPYAAHNLKNRLSESRTGGDGLSNKTRSFMESRFNADFGSVRIHTDNHAAQMARDVHAAAFTHGQEIYFGRGRYEPGSRSGQWLLAHELTHVIQQSRTGQRSAPSNSTLKSEFPIARNALPQISRLGRSDFLHLQRRTEVHVNLDESQSVKLFRQRGGDILFSPVSAGDHTEPLAGHGPFSITKRANPTRREGRWGLQYFSAFRGGIGFHSNIAYPTMRTLCSGGSTLCDPRANQNSRVRIELTVDGTPRSHGCVRMLPAHASRLFGAVSNGDRVYVYHGGRGGWQEPSWSPTSSLRPRGRSTRSRP